MIFNCNKCGKSISTKKDLCPYCKCDVSEISLIIEKAVLNKDRVHAGLKEKLKGTFAALKF